MAVVVVAAAVIAGKGVLTAAFVTGVAHVAVAIAGFVAVEVVEGFFSAAGHRSAIAAMWIIAVIDVAVKAVGAVEPGAGSEEDSAVKPVGAVVAVGGAVVGSVVVIAVRAYGGWADVDAEGNLGGGSGSAAKKKRECESGEGEEFDVGHDFSLILLERERGWGVVWKNREQRTENREQGTEELRGEVHAVPPISR
jgi:hypothetical protein